MGKKKEHAGILGGEITVQGSKRSTSLGSVIPGEPFFQLLISAMFQQKSKEHPVGAR